MPVSKASEGRIGLARSQLNTASMNPTHQLSPLLAMGQKLPVPIWMFEVTAVAIASERAGQLANRDELRDDKGLAEGSRHAQRPPGWSPLNDF